MDVIGCFIKHDPAVIVWIAYEEEPKGHNRKPKSEKDGVKAGSV
jgi:hypothetical protein